MKLKTKTTNPNYKKLIMTLWKSKRRAWREVVKWLNRPKRRRVSVNLNQINRNTKENDLVVVPGKVLGLGEINHKLQSIAAYSFSESAKKKIMDKNIKLETIEELFMRNPEGKNIKIII